MLNTKDIKQVFLNNIGDSSYMQTGVCYFSDHFDEVPFFISNGWKAKQYRLMYRLTPPRVTLADIVNCQNTLQYGDPVLNYLYFCFLKELSQNSLLTSYIDTIIRRKNVYYHDFAFHISVGSALEAEIVLYGSDKRIFNLKQDIISAFRNSTEYSNRLEKITRRTCKTTQFSQMKYASLLDSLAIEARNTCLSSVNWQALRGCGFSVSKDLIDNLDYDILIFITEGCYSAILDYINKDNIQKTLFWEYHQWIADITDSDSVYTGIVSHKLDFNAKKALIIDHAYSGRTLLSVKKMVEIRGGVPITLAIYPKSRIVMHTVDYVQILNKVYAAKTLDLEDPTLFNNIYTDTFDILSYEE